MNAIAPTPSFGQYDVLARLGDGTRGPVFAVCARREGQRDERYYALEVVGFASGEDDAARTFVHDVERAARIHDAHVVAILEVGATSAGRYVVTDTLDTASLAELEDRHRAIRPPRLVLATAIDALRGLHAAHTLTLERSESRARGPAGPAGGEGGRPRLIDERSESRGIDERSEPGGIDGAPKSLLHGRLSPDHLRVGLDGVCRIAGFGSAPLRAATKPSLRARTALGYVAPEHLTGDPVDARADLFSLGVVLWNALTGKKLFHDRIDHMTMSNVLDRRIPRPSAIGLSPPPAFDAIVLKALERDPARRFGDAAEMAEALREAARNAACLASESEVSEWVAVTFGGELATRRRLIAELAARSPAAQHELPALPPLTTGGGATDHVMRDELTIDELARATVPPPRLPTAPVLAPIAVAPASYPTSPRRQLALVALAAFGVVACVLGWRWALVVATTEDASPYEAAGELRQQTPPPAIELEITVLDVHPAAPPPALPPAPTTAAAPASDAPTTAAVAPAPPPTPAGAAAPAVIRPALRAVKRPLRAAAPARPEPRAEPVEAKPPEPKPAEPRLEAPPPPPAKPDPPRPTLEPNPYLQK